MVNLNLHVSGRDLLIFMEGGALLSDHFRQRTSVIETEAKQKQRQDNESSSMMFLLSCVRRDYC